MSCGVLASSRTTHATRSECYRQRGARSRVSSFGFADPAKPAASPAGVLRPCVGDCVAHRTAIHAVNVTAPRKASAHPAPQRSATTNALTPSPPRQAPITPWKTSAAARGDSSTSPRPACLTLQQPARSVSSRPSVRLAQTATPHHHSVANPTASPIAIDGGASPRGKCDRLPLSLSLDIPKRRIAQIETWSAENYIRARRADARSKVRAARRDASPTDWTARQDSTSLGLSPGFMEHLDPSGPRGRISVY
jgi:hypothetical protein